MIVYACSVIVFNCKFLNKYAITICIKCKHFLSSSYPACSIPTYFICASKVSHHRFPLYTKGVKKCPRLHIFSNGYCTNDEDSKSPNSLQIR